ncbi:hypothetical protein LOK49_LG15G00352 [Camellia lanceoleosa]|uniref:Uncharacterized protein n=1 Tax=Camellia lanceoleosa TaxID=1840588 RepID=A0ACC0F9G1_9ERIC|nr:hypothetical protein LOK49_LG15G00352 [Camellia lanceoleosa]
METFDLTEGCDECEDVSGLCLVGKILTPKTLNRTAVFNILQNAWKPCSQLEISSWGDNVYLFQFSESENRCKVLDEAPWSVIGNLLVLQPFHLGVAVSNFEFHWCPFWVQVHGLPLDKMSKKHGETIKNRLGKLIAVEALSDGLFLGRSFLRIRVEIDGTIIPLDGANSRYGLDMRTSMVKHIGAPYGSYRQPPVEDANADSLVRRSMASPSSTYHIEAGGGHRENALVLVAGVPIRGKRKVESILSCVLPQDFPLPQDTTCLPKPDGMQVTTTLSESGPA